MDACLTLSAASYLSLEFLWGVAQVAIALGFVIFVHELGHFAVAKMCGVQCDKFFVGFDIGGYKLSKKWGETEYGIGVLPLGGYVKMLGQDDDPAKISEQMAASQAAAEGIDESQTKEISGPDGKKYRVDRRSYMAKSVPQRMAIISAGVIMNVVFAFIFALGAYGLGVDYVPCVVGFTSPGMPAWEQGLEPGDEIIKLGDRENPSFTHLTTDVTLSDRDEGLPCVVRKASTGEEVAIRFHPEMAVGGVKIGVGPGRTTRLNSSVAAVPGSPAAEAGLEPGDEVIAINEQPVESFRDVELALARYMDETISVTVRREGEATSEAAKEQTVSVDPKPMKRLGLVMKMGPVSGVKQGSPAAAAGIKVGDLITAINGRPVGATPDSQDFWDPLTLPYDLRSADAPLQIKVTRGDEELEFEVAPLEEVWSEEPAAPGAPMPIASLGVAYPIVAEVQQVVPGSPAEAAGLMAGDVVVAAEQTVPEDSELAELDSELEFGPELPNWAYLLYRIQLAPLGSTVALDVKRGQETMTFEMKPAATDAAYVADRGFAFSVLMREQKVSSLSEAAAAAWDRTVFSVTSVYRFLRGLVWSHQVPMSGIGGPVKIAEVAYYHAQSGVAPLLLFLTMLSANLAVLNFLPIPVLDGGHMVFLAWEGVTGRPAGEKVVVALHTAGFIFLIGLMIFVIGNDIRSLL